MEALTEAQTYKFWFREKYSLPPTDPRFLAMTDRDVCKEFWTDQFYKVFAQGKTPTVDYFDTDFVDEALTRWAEEDEEFFEIEELKNLPDEWEDITP